jgi:hypothetical protein
MAGHFLVRTLSIISVQLHVVKLDTFLVSQLLFFRMLALGRPHQDKLRCVRH